MCGLGWQTSLHCGSPHFELSLVFAYEVQSAIGRVEQGEGEYLGMNQKERKNTAYTHTHMCTHARTHTRTNTHLQLWIRVLLEDRCGLSEDNICDLIYHHSRLLLPRGVPNKTREIHSQVELAKVGAGLESEGWRRGVSVRRG